MSALSRKSSRTHIIDYRAVKIQHMLLHDSEEPDTCIDCAAQAVRDRYEAEAGHPMSDEAFNDALVADFDEYHDPETAATILKRGLEMKETGVSISGGDPHMRINAAAATA